MTPAEHQAVVDITKVAINEYFDHYLNETFPRQMDQLFKAHNQDAEAHDVRFKPLEKVRRKADRLLWMILGGAVVIGGGIGLLFEHLPAIIKAFAG